MIELTENEYAKLKQDADDNNALKKIIFTISSLVLAAIIVGWIINPLIQGYVENWQQETSIANAAENIKKYDFNTDDYIELLKTLNSQK